MKPKVNKNLSLPWNPQGEKASGNHQILLPREKAASLIPPYICQVNTIPLPGSLVPTLWPRRPCCCDRNINTVIPLPAFTYVWAKAVNQKTTYLQKDFESAGELKKRVKFILLSSLADFHLYWCCMHDLCLFSDYLLWQGKDTTRYLPVKIKKVSAWCLFFSFNGWIVSSRQAVNGH